MSGKGSARKIVNAKKINLVHVFNVKFSAEADSLACTIHTRGAISLGQGQS